VCFLSDHIGMHCGSNRLHGKRVGGMHPLQEPYSAPYRYTLVLVDNPLSLAHLNEGSDSFVQMRLAVPS
jgi:hypothetical protein